MKHLQSFLPEVNTLCSLQVQQDGNLMQRVFHLQESCQANGKISGIHVVAQRMKLRSHLTPRALRFCRFMAKKTYSFIWVTDGYPRILQIADTSGFRLNGKTGYQLLSGILTGTLPNSNNSSS